jgi:hypothetical protein
MDYLSPSLNPVDASLTYEISVPLHEEDVSLHQSPVEAVDVPIDDDATDIESSFEEDTPKWHIISPSKVCMHVLIIIKL